MREVQSRVSDSLLRPLNKRIILVVIVTVIATELFIVTDIGPFRFSIGTVVFIYAILSLHHLLVIPTAILVALSTFLLRVGLDYFFWLPRDYFTFMMAHHYSGVVYFLVLSITLHLSGVRRGSLSPGVSFYPVLGAALAFSTLAEALVRVSPGTIFSLENLIILLFMSAVQVFLVSSLVVISHFKQTETEGEHQRQSYESMLILASQLYDELFYMQKSMENMENIMAKSYNLHRHLRDLRQSDRSMERAALEVAQEVHEVKKDTVRVFAGLSEILRIRPEKPLLNLSEVLDLVIKSNRNYGQSLDKRIHFSLRVEEDLEVAQVYPLLAIFNNLVSNAVEAIEQEGVIRLKARRRGRVLRICVSDNGSPIKERDHGLIFEPGFTTKFSAEGVPSTGIGLAYVRGLVQNFRGRVFLSSGETEKTFLVLLPVSSVTEE